MTLLRMFDPNPVTPLAGGRFDARVRAFRCGNIVDSFAVITERFLVLVDTMVSRASIETVMGTLARAVEPHKRTLLVINTHADWDHVWGNGLFVGPNARYPAPILGHRLMDERMASPEAAQVLASLQAENPGWYDTAEWWPPTLRFDGEMQIDGGDLTLQLIPTPGHTPDHLSIWIPEIRLLLAGDAAEMPFPEVGEAEALPELRASLQRLEELQADTVLYCHAPGVTDPVLIRHNTRYFDELERRCRQAIGRDASYDIAQIDDPAAVIGWPLEKALPPEVTLADLALPDFYCTVHDANIHAMLTWLAVNY